MPVKMFSTPDGDLAPAEDVYVMPPIVTVVGLPSTPSFGVFSLLHAAPPAPPVPIKMDSDPETFCSVRT